MTLCIAAICKEGMDDRLVICADSRAEVPWAGGNVAFKLRWAAPAWPALIAGETSKADDFLTTCWEVLKNTKNDPRSVFDKLNEASCAHKQKLCERLLRKRLGIPFERFLKQGEKELTPEVRTRVLYEIEELDFGCEVLVIGFDGTQPFIYSIDADGEVRQHQSFATIGTGSVIAKSTIYQREFSAGCKVEQALYTLYEAARLARIAPGVGATDLFIVLDPPQRENARPRTRMATKAVLKILEKTFRKFGPKPNFKTPDSEEDWFLDLGELVSLITELQGKTESKKTAK